MAATVASVLTAVRSHVAHDSDTQVTDAQLTAQVDIEYKLLRRALATIAPELFTKQSSHTVAAGAYTITKPTDFDRLWRLERLSGSLYYPVDATAPLNSYSSNTLVFIEMPTTIELQPTTLAAGTYRLTYLAGITAGYTSLDGIPEGLEYVVVMRVAAFAARRLEEDPSYFLVQAAEAWKMARRDLTKRNGCHGKSALNITRW